MEYKPYKAMFEPDLSRPYDRLNMVATSNIVRVNKQEMYGAADVKAFSTMMQEISKGNDRENGEPITIASTKAATIYGVSVSTLQSGIEVEGNTISGTLKYVENGTFVQPQTHFLALDFSDVPEEATKILIGLVPSYGSGFVDLYGDPEMNALIGITDTTQQFVVKTTVNGEEKIQKFSLSGLTLEPATD